MQRRNKKSKFGSSGFAPKSETEERIGGEEPQDVGGRDMEERCEHKEFTYLRKRIDETARFALCCFFVKIGSCGGVVVLDRRDERSALEASSKAAAAESRDFLGDL